MKAAFGWLSRYFSKGELLLWGCSMACILLSFAAFDRGSYLTLAASLIGATSLIFCAKGNPAGQVLMILFSLLYGLISFSFAYYGEMLTYLGMTAPMAVVSLVSWLRNPFQGNHSEVEVNRLPRREVPFMLVLTAAADGGILLPAPLFPHRKPAPQHPVRHYQLPGRLSHLPPQRLLSPGLRRQRSGADRAVDSGRHGGPLLPVGGYLLCDVPGQ